MTLKSVLAGKGDIERSTGSAWERKGQRIVKTAREPICASLCSIWFWCMVVVTLAMAVSDVVTYFRYLTGSGILRLAGNIATTGFFSMAFFSLILIPLNVNQVLRLRRRLSVDGSAVFPVCRDLFALKSAQGVEQPYRFYSQVSLGGIVLFGISWLVLSLL